MDSIFKLPKDVLWLIDLIEKNGFNAYIVGGCVRDIIMGRVPHDYDMTTDASPEDMIRIFQKKSLKMILNGLKHGTVGVCIHGEVYEITTFRIDGEYGDHRRPESVTFTKSIYEDLKRRDFTINAMAYNPSKGLIDICGGRDDIKKKIIRTVGNPYDRFSEDALRIMRAFRFSAQLSFAIEDNTLKAAEKLGASVGHIAMERVQEEFNKIILSDVTKVLDLHDYGILNCIIGNLQMAPKNSELRRVVECTAELEKKLSVRLSMLMMSMDLKNVKEFLKSLKYSNAIVKDVLNTMEGSLRVLTDKCHVKMLIRDFGVIIAEDVLNIKYVQYSVMGEKEKIKAIVELKENLKEIIKNKECCSKKDLAVTGNHIKELGVQGAMVGKVMDYLVQVVIENNVLNEVDTLISKAKEFLGIEKA
ncbi:tRNA nucleotidyltransferase (CCA-adding enzyme) [Hathewaya proteolytica DSM 3090]|uniref:tRNA nucleotidyltransferase (CCA-adding enzyme) n=1 Tax=Hathewaya proteolytica DSM 3090 TaxID=1121331 RepID=A0A1M6JMZ1_9CLOT|nr:CCA tRNA nucleotidyltransferase [Hathewaya proteolytica]SHJ47963.1 tRNA nucleotidyltransferase (CCA-adding enzyme) [Hathewaya proteolytica DSM 3090]